MDRRFPLLAFMSLGQRVYFLANPQLMNAETYFQQIRGFLESLTDCDLLETRHAAEQLGNITIIYNDGLSGLINAAGVTYFKATMEPILRLLFAEAGKKELIAIKSGVVSQQLRALPSTLTLNDTQKHLLDETILCLEVGANRAAVVMGWNLAYDFIRQWIFDNRLSPFNQALASHQKANGTPIYAPISNYEDFFKGRPSEATVIETCLSATIIVGTLHDNLRQHLRRRNDYAHRSFTTPSSDQVNAYIKDLLDIITSRPFR